MSTETTTFQYAPLSVADREIRLLRLPTKDPDIPPEKSNFTIFHASLDSSVAYRALSYSWGSPTPPKEVRVNDHLFMVTANLFDALIGLQREDEERVIWIDAICINQTDSIEKSTQVALMRHIYKRANEVLIWLGPSTPQTDCTMQEIRKLGGALLQAGLWEISSSDLANWDRTDEVDSKVARIKEEVTAIAKPMISQIRDGGYPFWWIMSDLGKRIWFRRVWCIQECSNARVATFRCGTEDVDFAAYWATCVFTHIFHGITLSQAAGKWDIDANFVWLFNLLTSSFPSELVGIRRKYLVGEGKDLISLLYTANVLDSSQQRIQATDPRDRVYALLGIAIDEAAREIVPDYTLSCAHTYIQVARTLLKHGHSDVLSLCRARDVCQDLPSWVPDWSGANRKPWAQSPFEKFFNASRTLHHALGAKESVDYTQIILEGYFVDQIEEVGHAFSMGIEDKFDYDSADGLFKDVDRFLQDNDRYTLGEKEEAMWRIPVSDTEVSDLVGQCKRAGKSSHMKEGYKILRKQIAEEATVEDLESGRISHASYLCQMERMYDCRPISSKTGFVGIGPMLAKSGDTIVIFKGAGVPYILRQEATKASWTLVGEAHIYGIMDGEFMEQNPELEDFIIQ
ncbi:heterokaryon incompatibility protein-domain-containing protein [Dendryphion nanum]|uniref:Heterokaryon incompatibility protein-domain-containing protein n=1 Tax=Dendryphion nanum TaxID=256645 RepID=A0A9P9EAW9_9PLEO|nr:heterokaryon incompatibility protein-domain-containing protein [Dendryphion nanum]